MKEPSMEKPKYKKFAITWEGQPSHGNLLDPEYLAKAIYGEDGLEYVEWDEEPYDKDEGAGWSNLDGTITLPDTEEAKQKVREMLEGEEFDGQRVSAPDEELLKWAGLKTITFDKHGGFLFRIVKE